MSSMIKCASELQQRAIDRIDFSSSTFIKSRPTDIPLLRRLLQTCTRIAPLIMPQNDAMTMPVLNHPDLALTNLIVPSEGPTHITHLIDWQGAEVAPFCMQCDIPPALTYTGPIDISTIDPSTLHPPWPSNFDEMTDEEQDLVRMHHRLACRHMLYDGLICRHDEFRHETQCLPHSEALANLVNHILRCIADGPHHLRGYLIDLQTSWDEFATEPCPIGFTDEEIAAHRAAQADMDEYKRNVDEFYCELDCYADGSVRSEIFEFAREEMEERRQDWDDVAMKGRFPFYEGAHSWFLT